MKELGGLRYPSELPVGQEGYAQVEALFDDEELEELEE